MSFWDGNQKIETTDYGDSLLVRVTTLPFGIAFYIAMLFCCIGGWALISGKSLVFSIFMLVAGISSVIKSSRQSMAELRITDHGIGAAGYLLPWKEIVSLEYSAGGEDGPSGFYAKTGRWGGQFLLEGLGQTETNEIIDKIYRRFPFVEMAEIKPSLISFLDHSEVITLGLSKSDK